MVSGLCRLGRAKQFPRSLEHQRFHMHIMITRMHEQAHILIHAHIHAYVHIHNMWKHSSTCCAKLINVNISGQDL